MDTTRIIRMALQLHFRREKNRGMTQSKMLQPSAERYHKYRKIMRKK
jgi:hypothetical protein